MLKTLCTMTTLYAASCGLAAGAPLAPLPQSEHAPIILVAGGCGPGLHRGPGGACIVGRRVIVGGPVVVEPRIVEPRVVAPIRLPPPCPRGYVRDPRPGVRLCYPRF